MRAMCQLKVVRLNVVNVYGYSGARTDASVRETNEQLIQAAVASTEWDEPGAILADLNMEPRQSPTICALLARGWVDVAEWEARRVGGQPQPTFQGNTRIDAILLNPQAAHLVVSGE